MLSLPRLLGTAPEKFLLHVLSLERVLEITSCASGADVGRFATNPRLDPYVFNTESSVASEDELRAIGREVRVGDIQEVRSE